MVFMHQARQSLKGTVRALLIVCAASVGCAASEGYLKSEASVYDQDLVWLSHQFNVRVDRQNLTVRSDVGTYTTVIEGDVFGADVGDMNRDGYPEILVYLRSSDTGRYGSVIGYSSNRGRSMSQIYAPLATTESRYSCGYRGRDEFAIVEDSFVQRFSISPEDRITSESSPTTRQIQYKLVDGEAGRKLVVSSVVEY